MATGTTGFLVVRRNDGFGDVFPLDPAQSYSLGRAATNAIVLKDDLCSREHSEVFSNDGAWYVRDLNSLNGTHVNGSPLRKEQLLRPLDEIRVGRTFLVFTEDLNALPDLPRQGGTRSNEQLSVSGQRREFNYYTLDGVDNTDVNFNTYIFMPSRV